MKDTPKHISDIQRRLVHSKTNEERSAMGAEIIDSVYEMIKDRIQQEEPESTSKEIRAKVFLRYYQNEFSDQQKEKIVASIKSS